MILRLLEAIKILLFMDFSPSCINTEEVSTLSRYLDTMWQDEYVKSSK